MKVCLVLLLKILPLYLLILLGYIAGKKLNVKKESIAPLLIYIIAPVVFFNSILKTNITPELMLLPFIFFLTCTSVCLLTYYFSGKLFKDNTKNLLALTAGTANTGYFGIPVAIEILGEDILGLFILCIIGFSIFEASVGFYVIARGRHSVMESVERVLKLPTLYALIAGVIVNISGFQVGSLYETFANNFIGAYSVCGMMLIGLGLSDIKGFNLDLKYLSSAFLIKFVLWPLLALGFILVDKTVFGLFSEEIYKIIILVSITPLAANLVAFATEFRTHPDKASSAVFLSTIFALFYIPLITTLVF